GHGRGGSYAWAARAADPSRGRGASTASAVPGEPAASAEPSRDQAVPPPSSHTPDTALIQFTSGTTGPPKPVLLRHSGISALLEPVLAKLVGAGRKPRADPMPNLIPTSLSLWAGIYNVLFAFRVGAPVVLMERFDTRRFAGYVRRFGIRSVVLPPAAMVMLTDDAAVADLAPLTYVRSITAPLSPFHARRFRDRFGVTVLNCYGQTEIGGEIVGWNAADARAHGEAKLGAVGRPHDGVALAIRDGDGTDLPRGISGELWVRTPALADGYANGAGLADRLDPDGWFRTGDIGRVDADGFLWIDGRASDMINRGGLKVFPAEVAEVLGAAPGVAEAAVVGVPDPRLGEVPWAVVVPRTPGGIDAAVLDAWCREHLAPFKVPVRYATVEALPRTEAGKVRTAELAALARDAPDAPTPGGTAP
ncbi:MAG: long-chain fatty acid--CoA ligase, partial [Streptomycetaceae bacterium]|nr:long-chain fatty acid--CoA ligase [Streptomycetaceae bacterium]